MRFGGVLVSGRREGFLVRVHWRSSIAARVLRINLVQSVAIDHIAGKLDVVILDQIRTRPKLLEPMITYGELADFCIIHAENLCLFTCTKTKTRDEVHDEQDDAGSAKGIGEAGRGVGKLVG